MWYNEEWVEKFVLMVISISQYLGGPATIIEMHPGDRRNSYKDISSSILFLMDQYYEAFQVKPLILLENRTGQFISSGSDLEGFWDYFSENHRNLRKNVGIVLDIQQLYTVTKKTFKKSWKPSL